MGCFKTCYCFFFFFLSVFLCLCFVCFVAQAQMQLYRVIPDYVAGVSGQKSWEVKLRQGNFIFDFLKKKLNMSHN